jgi:hypothetical protein
MSEQPTNPPPKKKLTDAPTEVEIAEAIKAAHGTGVDFIIRRLTYERDLLKGVALREKPAALRTSDPNCRRFPEVCGNVAEHHNPDSKVCQLPRAHAGPCFGNAMTVADWPELDATDVAHPAWWRGHDYAVLGVCYKIKELLDGKTVGGKANEPWETIRQRIVALQAERDKLREELERARQLLGHVNEKGLRAAGMAPVEQRKDDRVPHCSLCNRPASSTGVSLRGAASYRVWYCGNPQCDHYQKWVADTK